METVDCRDRVCVVGAGSSGLAAARNLKQQGFAVDVLEREDDLGGNWNYCKPNARVYRSTRMISSKRFTQYPDFKFPKHYPDYPHHAQVLEYLRDYAAFGLAQQGSDATEALVPVRVRSRGKSPNPEDQVS